MKQEMQLMKILVTGTVLALTALAASPAFARSSHSRMSAAPAIGYDSYAASDAYAAAPGYTFGGSPAVIFDNKVIGQDPDPNVRLNIYRDPGLLAN